MSQDTNDKELLATWPEVIYLQGGDDDGRYDFNECDVTWCTDSIYTNDIKYVRKDIADADEAKLKLEITSLGNCVAYFHDLLTRAIPHVEAGNFGGSDTLFILESIKEAVRKVHG